jgi:ornithine carbamoyltransferase
MKHFLKIGDYDRDQLQEMLDQSSRLQKEPEPLLARRNILFAFEKPSLRTKVGTEVAVNHLGGRVIHVEADVLFGSGADPVFGCRETMRDTMKNVSQWCDAIFARVFRHETLESMVSESTVPIVNALCDRHHPMQAMADLYTIQEKFGREKKVVVTFVGDANNVARSLIEICLMFGHEARFSGPAPYYWDNGQVGEFEAIAKRYGGTFTHSNEPRDVAKGADVLYTDTFVSMGEEEHMDEKLNHFKPYQVNGELYTLSNQGQAGFMHCLPAHRGIEVTEEVIDHPNSWIYQQAKNRMVVSKGVFVTLLSEGKSQ